MKPVCFVVCRVIVLRARKLLVQRHRGFLFQFLHADVKLHIWIVGCVVMLLDDMPRLRCGEHVMHVVMVWFVAVAMKTGIP